MKYLLRNISCRLALNKVKPNKMINLILRFPQDDNSIKACSIRCLFSIHDVSSDNCSVCSLPIVSPWNVRMRHLRGDLAGRVLRS